MNLTAKQKKGIRVLACVVLALTLVYNVLTSTFFFCEVYLPLFCDAVGYEIDAGAIDFDLFTLDKNLCLENVKIERGHDFHMTINKVRTRLRLSSLLLWRIRLDGIDMDGVDICLGQENFANGMDPDKLDRLSKQLEKGFPDWCEMDHIRLRNVDLRYIAENHYNNVRFFVREINVASLHPEAKAELNFSCFLNVHAPPVPPSADGTTFSNVHLNLTGSGYADLDKHLMPLNFDGQLDLHRIRHYETEPTESGRQKTKGTGHASFHAEVRCSYHAAQGGNPQRITLEKFEFVQRVLDVEKQVETDQNAFQLSATGEYDLEHDLMHCLIQGESSSIQSVFWQYGGILPLPLVGSATLLKTDEFSGNFQAVLNKNKNQFDFFVTTKAHIDKFQDGNRVLCDVLDAENSLHFSYDMSLKKYSLYELSSNGYLSDRHSTGRKNIWRTGISSSKNASAEDGNGSDHFVFFRKEGTDGTSIFEFEGNDAEFHVDVKSAPLTLLNVILPVPLKGGTLDMSYSVKATGGKEKRFIGDLTGVARNVENPFYEVKMPGDGLKTHDIRFSAKCQTSDLSEIQNIIIPKTDFQIVPAAPPSSETAGTACLPPVPAGDLSRHSPFGATPEARAGTTGVPLGHPGTASGTASGTYRPFEKILQVKGSLTFHPYSDHFPFYHCYPQALKHAISHASDGNVFRNPMNVDFSCTSDFKTRKIDLSASAVFPLTFLQQANVPDTCFPTPMVVKMRAKSCAESDVQKYELTELEFDVPGHFSLLATGHGKEIRGKEVKGNNTSLELELDLKKISSQFFKSVCLFFEHDNSCLNEILSKLKFENITAKTTLHYDSASNTLTALRAGIDLMPTVDSHLLIQLDEPLRAKIDRNLVWEKGNRKAHANVINFSGANINAVVKDKTKFKFGNFPIDGTIDITLFNGFEKVRMVPRFKLTEYSCSKWGRTIRHGNIELTGQVHFLDYFSKMEYTDAVATSIPYGKGDFYISSNGLVLLTHPMNNKFHFDIHSVGAHQIQNLCDEIKNNLEIEDFSADGCLDIQCSDDINIQNYDFRLNIRKLVLRRFNNTQSHSVPPVPLALQGTFCAKQHFYDRLNQQVIDDLSINLVSQPDGKNILHAAFSGMIFNASTHPATPIPQPNAKSTFQSNGIDFTVLSSVMKNKKRASGTGSFGPSVPLAPAITMFDIDELPPLQVQGKCTNIHIDIKNWIFGKHINFNVKGEINWQNDLFRSGKLQGDVNQSPFSFIADVDPTQDSGWKINTKAELKNLDIKPFVDSYGDDEIKKKVVSGVIKDASFSFHTEGLSTKKLDDNLNFNANINFENLNFYLQDPKEFNFLSVLVFPLVTISHTIDKIPGNALLKYSFPQGIAKSAEILSGKEKVSFNRGQVILRSDDKIHTDIHFDKCLFVGPSIKMQMTDKSTFNPVHNQINAESIVFLKGILYLFHVKLNGKLSSPDSSSFQSITDECKRYWDSISLNLQDSDSFSNFFNIFFNQSDDWNFAD